MGKLFYRFRSIEKLIKYEELEKQTIYFAHPSELNDPMEGFKNIVWHGDLIVWENLFKHYLFCLEYSSGLFTLIGEENHTVDIKQIPIYNCTDKFPSPMYKDRFEKLSSEFLSLCGQLIKKISFRTTPISKNELKLYLTVAHQIALYLISKSFIEHNLVDSHVIPQKPDPKILESMCTFIDTLEQILQNKETSLDVIENILFVQNIIQEELTLINDVNNDLYTKRPNANFILVEFTQKYLDDLEKLTYPDWYAACFMSEANNSSVWGNYGENHRGICLIFESNESDSINLHGKIGIGGKGPIFGNKLHKFYEIKYQEEYKEIDFFTSLGRLPIATLQSTWYQNGTDTTSIKANEIFHNEESWRKIYWENYYRDICIKTKDWNYENEYRLILNDLLESEIEKKFRLLTYDFTSLKGLIFGIKTPRNEKVAIIKIIEKKCKQYGRNDFEFFQAYFSQKHNNIQYKKLSFIKFQDNSKK